MSKYGLFGKFIVKQEEKDDLVSILLAASNEMERLNECEIYHVSISEQAPDAVFVYEEWTTEKAHQDSLSLEVTQTLIKRAKPIIKGMERISTLKVMG